jgi:hypothetical protein
MAIIGSQKDHHIVRLECALWIINQSLDQLTRSIFAALPFILPSGIEDIDLIAASCSVNN